MPDPELLPPGRDLHAVPLPPGTLSAIQARARRRRAARAATAGSAGMVLVAFAAAAVLTSGTGVNDSLRLQPAVPATTVPSLPPQPTPTADALPTPQPGATQQDRDQEIERPTPAPVANRPDPTAPPSAAQAPPAADAPNRSTQDPEARRTDEGVVILKPDCGQASPEDTEGWCLEAEADPDDQSLSLGLCRAQDSPPGRLHWPNSQQVRFSITDGSSKTIWTYDPQVRPQASTEEVPPGRCVGWQAPWPVVDEQGQPLAPGTYTLLASTTADGLDKTEITHRFQIR